MIPLNVRKNILASFWELIELKADGHQQVTGFYMTGELLGLEAISPEKHTCDTVAFVGSEVCQVPFGKLEEIGRNIPVLMSQFHKIMSREIVQDHSVMMLLGSMSAEERLTTFCLIYQLVCLSGAIHRQVLF